MRNCNADVEPGMRPMEPMPASQFRIPHSALRIRWLILAEHMLGRRAESTAHPLTANPQLPPPLPAPRSLLPPCDLGHMARGLADRSGPGIFRPSLAVATEPP